MTRNCSGESQTRRIKESSTDSEENPCIDSQGKAKAQTDVQQSSRVRCRRRDGTGCFRVGNLCASESKEEEQKCAGKLARHGDEMISSMVWQPVEKR